MQLVYGCCVQYTSLTLIIDLLPILPYQTLPLQHTAPNVWKLNQVPKQPVHARPEEGEGEGGRGTVGKPPN